MDETEIKLQDLVMRYSGYKSEGAERSELSYYYSTTDSLEFAIHDYRLDVIGRPLGPHIHQSLAEYTPSPEEILSRVHFIHD